MRGMPILAAFLALASPALAADKGKPEAKLDHLLKDTTPLGSCALEVSGSGVIIRNDREAQYGAGIGCDAKLFNLLVGGGIRGDFSDWRDVGSVHMRMGVYLNNGATVYGIGTFKIPEWNPKNAGQFGIGLGTEIKLDIINPNASMFIEGTIDASKYGSAAFKDEAVIRFGGKYKLLGF